MLARQERRRLAVQGRKLVHVVVDRLERAVPGIAQHLVEAALLGLAGEERDAELLRLAHVLRHLRQHGDAAGDVEAADADRQPGGQELPRQVDGARKLVGLHADQTDQRPAALLADLADDPVRAYAPVGFVVGMQADFDAGSQHVAALGVHRQAVEAGERVGRDGRAEPLDGIAVVIVMRRLDHHEMEERVAVLAPARHHGRPPT